MSSSPTCFRINIKKKILGKIECLFPQYRADFSSGLVPLHQQRTEGLVRHRELDQNQSAPTRTRTHTMNGIHSLRESHYPERYSIERSILKKSNKRYLQNTDLDDALLGRLRRLAGAAGPNATTAGAAGGRRLRLLRNADLTKIFNKISQDTRGKNICLPWEQSEPR